MAFGPNLVRSAKKSSFTHDHAPKLHKHRQQGDEAPQIPKSRTTTQRERDSFHAEAKRHGNYPWVGRNRQPLGHSTDIASGGHLAGIGPSHLHLMGCGSFTTLTLKDRFGSSFFADKRPSKAVRPYHVEQPKPPRSAALAQKPSQPRRRHFTDWQLHNLRGLDLMSLRNKDEFPPPGQYGVADPYFGRRPAASFGPANRAGGIKLTTGRTCSQPPASQDLPKPRLKASRPTGPLYRRGQRLVQRPQSAIGPCSISQVASMSRTMSMVSSNPDRLTLKTFLRKVQQAVDAEAGGGRGGASFRSYHPVATTPVRVPSNMWRQTSMAEYCRDRYEIVYDRDRQENVTVRRRRSRAARPSSAPFDSSAPMPSFSFNAGERGIDSEGRSSFLALPPGIAHAQRSDDESGDDAMILHASLPEDEEVERIMQQADVSTKAGHHSFHDRLEFGTAQSPSPNGLTHEHPRSATATASMALQMSMSLMRSQDIDAVSTSQSPGLLTPLERKVGDRLHT